MKRAIRTYCLLYSSVATIAAGAWYLASIFGRAALPECVWAIETLFCLHALAAVFTFHRTPIRPAWKPVLPTDAHWLYGAKLIFLCALVNFLLCLGIFIEKSLAADSKAVDRMLPLILTSFVLLNTTYIFLHWAFRPENLFSKGFMNAMTNPVGWVFSGRASK